MKSYESTLKLFQKYLEEEYNVITATAVITKQIKDYIEFTRNKGKYSYVADTSTTINNNPSARGDFRKQVSLQLLMDAGMRIGETLSLKTENILLIKKLYLLQQKLQKVEKIDMCFLVR